MLFLLVCLLPLEVFGRQEASSGQTALVFTHVTVIDATGAPAKPDMTVVVRGERIEALGKTSKLTVPENAQVVDATGKFLIPGLWDMHIHPLNKKDYLALFTANGVTGVRVMWGEPVHHKWRKEISAGKLIGPRMVISSPTVDGPESVLPGTTVVSNEAEGRQVVRKVKKEGADLVKVFNDIPRDAYFAIADEAKKQGIPFAGHVPYLVSAAEASDAGQQSIEHCYFVSLACSSRSEEELRKKLKETLVTLRGSLPHVRARVKLLADITYSEKKAAELFARFVKNNTWVCPTLIVWHGLLFRDEEDLANDPRLKYMPLSTKDSWKNDVHVAFATGEGRADWRKLCEKHLAIVGAMRDAGVGLLAGTDTYMPGLDLQDELAVFVQAGLSPMQALQTATYNPAKCLGKLDSMGTVERGKVADLVLLDADPLQDISNTQKIAAVVVGGKIFQRAALQKMLAQVEAARLHYAAAEGNIEHVKLLVSEGADVNARDQQGWTPALAALYGGELAVTDLLVEKGADTNTPHLAAYTGNLRGIKSLLEKDAPMDGLEGFTLLHAAAAGGHTDVVEFLIAEGFEATATTEDYETTPLHLAALSGHKEVAELLIDKGADLNQENSNGATPLHVAAVNGHRPIAELLIKAGAEVNVQKNNKWGETPLHYATWAGHKNVAGLLIARGANVNARDNEQSTPLHFAANRGHKDVLELLIAKGADVSAKNQRGESPLSIAKAKGHKELVELLRKHKARSGQTALVFTHVTVIDSTGAPAKPDMTVVVRGDRIEVLGKTGKLAVPRNAQVVDATGKFLIPGLWDMYNYPHDKKEYLALFIANGVTGMRVMWGDTWHYTWRKEILAGELIGPRMIISGKPSVGNEEAGRQAVRKIKKEGADLVRVDIIIPRDAYFAIADEANKLGIPFVGHLPYGVSLAEASDAGQKSIGNCAFVLAACSSEGEEELRKKGKKMNDTMGELERVLARYKLIADITHNEKKAAELFTRFVRNSTWVCPTLIYRYEKLFSKANEPRLKYMPLSIRDRWKNDVRVATATEEIRANHMKFFEKNLAIVGAMNDAGVGLLAGTGTYMPGLDLQDELVLLVQAGLSPMEALQTATYNAAKCLGLLDSMGTVERGKVADLVLLDSNPLQDISNTRRIVAVVVGGKIYQKAALQKMLAQIEATAKKSKKE